jgi:hypothetical protein
VPHDCDKYENILRSDKDYYILAFSKLLKYESYLKMCKNYEGQLLPVYVSVHYMPDGSPAPYVMNSEDAIKFLRIDTNRTKAPEATLQYYINEGLLRPITIGKCRKYTLPELLKFIERLYEAKDNVS